MEEHSSLKNNKTVSFDESLNLREQFDKYFVNWKWFVLSLFISLIIAFLYLRYTIPQYNAKATILVRDDRKGNVQSELTAFSELGIIKNMKNNVDNEIEIIKSRNIIEKAIQKLNFNIKYSAEGRVKNVELYKDSPFEVSFFETNDLFYKQGISYKIKSKSPSSFELFKNETTSIGVFNYGQIIIQPNGKMVVSKKPLSKNEANKSLIINVNVIPLDNVVQSYLSRLTVAPINKNSSVVELSINDPVAEKAEDFLNKVIEVYNQDAIDDKNIVSKNTQDFIDERLKYITQDLGDVEKEGEVYKTNNRITEITEDANLYTENSASFEKSLIETETQIRVINSMISYLNSSAVDDIIPSNIIPSDSNASMLIVQFNELITKRNRVLTSATTKNETVIALNDQISNTRRSIRESLYRLLESLKIKRNDLKNQEQSLNSKISQIPRQSRELNNIMRQQQIKQSLYLYLMQKREEIGISLAVAAPNAKIVDYAKGSKSPVSPNKMFILLAAFAAGIVIPFLVIFVKDLLDTKIKNRQDIESKTNIPFLGDI
ncbi:MAG: GNVR domain-containing protein, partial [Cytophagales bacterium]